MWIGRMAIVAVAGALGVAFAATPVDARHGKRERNGGWNPGFVITSSGAVYGPHYGEPTYPSFWHGPTSGVYAFDTSLCYAPRAYPSYGLQQWQLLPQWHWRMEYIC